MAATTIVCPGCRVELGARLGLEYARKFHSSAECWALYEEVLRREYADATLFARVHRLTVDAYSVQHAGGAHPDKSVDVHLVGLYLALERDFPLDRVPAVFRALTTREGYPHFEPPADPGALNIAHVAATTESEEHARVVRAWSECVWVAWSEHHDAVRRLADTALEH